MEREAGKFNVASTEKVNISRLQEMDKSEIIKQCLTLTSALGKLKWKLKCIGRYSWKGMSQMNVIHLKLP